MMKIPILQQTLRAEMNEPEDGQHIKIQRPRDSYTEQKRKEAGSSMVDQ